MKNFTKYRIEFTPFDVDLLSGYLWDLDIKGISEAEKYIEVFTESESKNFEKELEELFLFLQRNGIVDNFALEQSEVENKNWNEEWEKTVKVIKVTDKITIKPSFREHESVEGEVVVTIDPKMSFGTGDHESTQLVMTMIEKHIKTGDKVLDLGSGTAVLGILAAKLGAEKVICIDNDEWCLLNGKENVRANNVEDKVDVRLGIINDIKETGFNLIAANINKNILVDLPKDLAVRTIIGGRVILSGLLETDKEDIKKCYIPEGLNPVDELVKNEWITLVFERIK